MSRPISAISPSFLAESRVEAEMNFLETIQAALNSPARPADSYHTIENELAAGLAKYWKIAERILQDSGVRLLPPHPEYFAPSRNFFSLLFLYSYHRATLPAHRRILYVAINQCLRGMVTGCDNILDDEYKKTLSTDLPENATRMRSVLDIMVSDRVLYELLMDACRKDELTLNQVATAGAASLRALTQSGAEEAGEEGGIDTRLSPEEIINKIHHYKTALLFQCVWAIPESIEPLTSEIITPLKQALYEIGMGCQIFDDMVDLYSDILNRRHNYVASLIYHAASDKNRSVPETELFKIAELKKEINLITLFPEAKKAAARTASGFLEKGLNALFVKEHKTLIQPAIQFIAQQIGAAGFLPGATE